MKETSFMLTMLILGPKSPAKDIDVFLRPLIEELKTLWGGVWTKYVATGTYFNMKATLLWTINDFPARSSLSGWIGQGYFACPTCNKETSATRVRGKIAYVGYRRFLRVSHLTRNKKKEFQGEVERAIQGGPEEYRWMYPFKRYMKKLKNYVRNKAKPEGSIAKGYITEEALTFCSHYLKGVEIRFNRHKRNEDGLNRTHEFQVFRSICKLVGKEVYTPLSAQVKQRVVSFVLNNTSKIEMDIEAYKKAFSNNVVEEEFPPWFDDQIRQKSVKKDPTCTPELFFLACGPNAIARSFTTCLVNGVRFLVHERDIHRTTQNSRVSTPGERREIYYGRLKEILELTYIENRKVEQDVIHGDTSFDVALSNEFPNLDEVLSTNDKSTEVDVPLDTKVRDDDDFIYDIDDVAHDIGSDDEVDPTYDEFAEVGPARIDVMVLSVAPSYHGGDAGGDPPKRLNKLLPHQCEGGYSLNLVSLIGNLVKNLPLDYDKWDQILETTRVSILPELKRVEKSAKNAENRAEKRTSTYQGSKSFAQGRHEYFVKKGRYQDLITHWRDKHSHKGVFDNSENEDLYARMKSIKDQVNARTIEFKSDKEIIADVTKSTNREHEPGVGRKLPMGTDSSSRISPKPNQDYCTREQITEIIRQEVADKEMWKKVAEEASQQADLAKKQADLAKKLAESANERAARVELILDKFMGHYKQQQTQASGFSFTPALIPTTLVPETISAHIPDPYSDPNHYYKVMNPGSSRIPNDDEDGDDQDGNDKDGNGNNEDGNGSGESSSASDAE
ncbi:hypothetical protein Tco_1417896 [Tanacetum coccineum]